MKIDYHKFKPKISAKAKQIGMGKIAIGSFTVVEDNVLLDTRLLSNSSIMIGRRCKIKYGAVLRTYNGIIEIGDRTTVGEYAIIAGHGNVKIGKCTGIAGHCYISSQQHIINKDDTLRFLGETAVGIEIGDNVWIGGNVMIMDGVVIGDNCIIGAGSIITKSMPASKICYGAPCRPIRDKPNFYNEKEEQKWNMP